MPSPTRLGFILACIEISAWVSLRLSTAAEADNDGSWYRLPVFLDFALEKMSLVQRDNRNAHDPRQERY
jgi:hypothetical protein